MTLNWAPYQSASGCVKYGPAGAQALLTYSEDVFAALARSMGICNCRSVRGGSSWSHHAECRALDLGFLILAGRTFAYDYAVILGQHGARVGIDHLITNRKPWASDRGEPIIFSARSPNGRTYTGAHPHKDHNHIGLTRAAGRNLTYATLVAVYGRPEDVAARLLLSRPQPSEDTLLPLQYGHGYNTPPTDSGLTGNQAHKREDVKLMQSKLGAEPDGYYGSGTVAKVAARFGGDGRTVGGVEYAALDKAPNVSLDVETVQVVKGIRLS